MLFGAGLLEDPLLTLEYAILCDVYFHRNKTDFVFIYVEASSVDTDNDEPFYQTNYMQLTYLDILMVDKLNSLMAY